VSNQKSQNELSGCPLFVIKNLSVVPNLYLDSRTTGRGQGGAGDSTTLVGNRVNQRLLIYVPCLGKMGGLL
jgi:hypothetical protein